MLTVVYLVDIHLANAINTIHQSCEWVHFAPTVGITLYLSFDALNVIKDFWSIISAWVSLKINH